MSESAAKIYVPGEERLNVWSHALGTLFALVMTVTLLAFSTTVFKIAGAVIYGVSLCVLFCGSTLYHAAKEPVKRAKLRQLDHAAIYFLIAGTYTPLMLVGLPDVWGLSVMAAVWLLGITGVTLELLKIKPFKGFSIIIYILMGWACAVIMPDLIHKLPGNSFACLLAGGIAYTAGVPFYILRKDYSHALWHVFVLVGAVLQFMAILLLYR